VRNALFLGVGLLLLVVQGNLYRILGHIPLAGIMPNLVLPLIVFMGVHLIDNMAIEGLTATCKRLGRFEFLFAVAPLNFARATGSPVNPLAIL